MGIPGVEKNNRKDKFEEEQEEKRFEKLVWDEVGNLQNMVTELHQKLNTFEEIISGLLNVVEEHINKEEKKEVKEEEPEKTIEEKLQDHKEKEEDKSALFKKVA